MTTATNTKEPKKQSERRADADEPAHARTRVHPRLNEAAWTQSGNVVLRVYANSRKDGGVVHKVELVRIYSTPAGEGETFSFEVRDLLDAIHCLKWALSWYWHEERRIRRSKQPKRAWW